MKVYFIYSAQQLNIKKEANKRLGKDYVPGQVLVNGKMRPFTEIVSSIDKATYSDSVVVTFGEKSRMKYKK